MARSGWSGACVCVHSARTVTTSGLYSTVCGSVCFGRILRDACRTLCVCRGIACERTATCHSGSDSGQLHSSRDGDAVTTIDLARRGRHAESIERVVQEIDLQSAKYTRSSPLILMSRLMAASCISHRGRGLEVRGAVQVMQCCSRGVRTARHKHCLIGI